MKTYQNSTELKNLTLGKSTEYSGEYNPNLLQAVPRQLNRADLSISDNTLPFIGEDVWYGYELSWLNERGKPIVALAEFRFDCHSHNLVESKSFKLYLNSFNQTKFSNIQLVERILTEDLSKTARGEAKVKLFSVDECPPLAINHNDNKYICIDDEDISIDSYSYQSELLQNSQKNSSKTVEENLVSHLLKSNCLITNQPDWATIYISYEGQAIKHSSLLKYLISFREHNEFHEQCVERIYCDLKKHCQLKKLTIFARYTRRGGLDINPFRSSHQNFAPHNRTIRQ